MKKALAYRSQSIIFRQWTRKNYAVFASLGKEISIGHVDVDISDKALIKCNKKKSGAIDKLESGNDEEESDEFLFDFIDQQFITSLLVISNLDESSQQFCCLFTNYNSEYLNKLSCNSGHNSLLYKSWYYDN